MSLKSRPRDLVPVSLEAKMVEWRNAAKSWVPHAYQERAVRFELENSFAGLLLCPGLGKTSITLAAIKVLLSKKLIKRALIIAPLRAVYDVWPAEMSDWQEFHSLGVALLHGPQKDKVLRELKPEHQICLMNFEGIPWLMTDKPRMKMLGADMLVIDELSKLKSSVSQRFRRLRPNLASFSRRVGLTGSPVPRHYMDLFGQIYVIDRGAALGEYITHYRNKYFFPTGYDMHDWELLPDSKEQIEAAIAPLVLRLAAEDYLKLPKVLERIHKVELPPAARKDYDAVEDKLMGTLFTQPLTSSAAARSKCAQIANGAVYLEDTPEDLAFPSKKRRFKVVHSAKVDAVVDLYEELQGEQLLLFIGYHHDVDTLRAALGKDIPCINGETTRGQSAKYIEQWNKGLLDVLMVHPASAGHALNLQKFSARHVGFFYIPDDYDQFDQGYRRVWRQGNKADFVMRHLFIADKTVDVPKLANLRRKGNGQRDFLNAMKAYAEERVKEKKGTVRRKK